MSSCPPLAGADQCVNDFIDQVDDSCLIGIREALRNLTPRLDFLNALLFKIQIQIAAINAKLVNLLSFQIDLENARGCLDAFPQLLACPVLLVVSAAVDAAKTRIDIEIAAAQGQVSSIQNAISATQTEINDIVTRISDTASLKTHLEGCLA